MLVGILVALLIVLVTYNLTTDYPYWFGKAQGDSSQRPLGMGSFLILEAGKNQFSL